MIRLTMMLTAGALMAAPALAADEACEIDRPVVFADLNYGSAQFHTAVASRIIKDGFGCDTDSIPGDTIPLINGVARGDADVIMEIWTANPAQAWVDAEAKGDVVALGTTFPDAVEGWYVPTSVVSGADAVAPDLKAVADLKDHVELFADPEEPGKGRFYNCPAGWHCEVVNGKKLEAYGLAADYTNFLPGTGEALAAAAEAGALRDKPVVFYYWGPTWLLGKYDFTKLEEPPYNKAVWDAMMESDKPTEATASPITKVIIGANTAFTKEATGLADFLKAYSSDNATTSAALAYMRDNDASADEAAVNFLKTSDQWKSWVSDAVVEKVQAGLGG